MADFTAPTAAADDPYAAPAAPAPDPQPAPAPDQPAQGQDSAALQAQIAQLQQQIQQLQAENQQLQQRAQQAEAAAQQAQGEAEQAKNTLTQVQAALEEEKANHQADVQEAQQQIADAKTAAQQGSAGGDPAVQAQLTTLQAENARLQAQLDATQGGQAPSGPTPPGAGGVVPTGLGPNTPTFGGPPPGALAALEDRLTRNGGQGFDTPGFQNGTFEAPPTDLNNPSGVVKEDPVFGADFANRPAGQVPAAAVANEIANPSPGTTHVNVPGVGDVLIMAGPDGQQMMVVRDALSANQLIAISNATNDAQKNALALRKQEADEAATKYQQDVANPRAQENFNRTQANILETARIAARGRGTPTGQQGIDTGGAAPPTFGRGAAAAATPPVALSGPQLGTVDPNAERIAREQYNQRAQAAEMERQRQESINQTQLQIAAMQNQRGSFRTPTFGRFRR